MEMGYIVSPCERFKVYPSNSHTMLLYRRTGCRKSHWPVVTLEGTQQVRPTVLALSVAPFEKQRESWPSAISSQLSRLVVGSYQNGLLDCWWPHSLRRKKPFHGGEQTVSKLTDLLLSGELATIDAVLIWTERI